MQAAWLREVDPTAKGFWQRVARLVPGSKTAEECHSAYMEQFGSTPAEKPKRAASQKAGLAMQGDFRDCQDIKDMIFTSRVHVKNTSLICNICSVNSTARCKEV